MERLCIILVVIATGGLFVKDILGTEYKFPYMEIQYTILRKLGRAKRC